MIKLRLLLLFLLAAAPVGMANDASWPLEGKEAASGTFQQIVKDGKGDIAFSSTGSFIAVKPDYFRWDIQSPDQQQLIATPEGFWQWDKDLDVVIRRDPPELNDLPISAIWSGHMPTDSQTPGSDSGIGGSSIKNLSVRAISADRIIVLFEDVLGQETRFEFTLDLEVVIPPSAFDVIVPDGVDFYDESSRRSDLSGFLE